MLEGFDKAFENRVRLGMMASLMTNQKLDFNELKSLLDVTDGNLASHIAYLEKIEYIEVFKSFIGKKPNTSLRISKLGELAFKKHIQALEKLMRK
jgi:predicted transcriptional regulator